MLHTRRKAEIEILGTASSADRSFEGEDGDDDEEMDVVPEGDSSEPQLPTELVFMDRQDLFDNASNLRALRLLNDVYSETKPGKKPQRLERYSGPQVFLFDAQTSADGAARCVNSA